MTIESHRTFFEKTLPGTGKPVNPGAEVNLGANYEHFIVRERRLNVVSPDEVVLVTTKEVGTKQFPILLEIPKSGTESDINEMNLKSSSLIFGTVYKWRK